jgi:hypothetical protein
MGNTHRVGRAEGKLPHPKQSGIIRHTKVWEQAVGQIINGQFPLVVTLGPTFGKDNGLTDPLYSFATTLKRWVKRQVFGKDLSVYVRGGKVYVVRAE